MSTSRTSTIRTTDTGQSIAVVGDVYRFLERMFLEVSTPVEQGATTAPQPTAADFEKLLKAAPSYGVEILLPKH